VPSAFLFDLDQTLLDRAESLRGYLPKQFQRFCGQGHGGEEAFVRRFIDLDAGGYGDKRLLYETLRVEFDLQAGTDELIEDFRSNCFREARLFEGVEELLHALVSIGHRLGLVTNGSSGSQRAKIEATEIEGLFDSILISGDLGMSKPDLSIFQLAADALGANCEECVFVGDHPERDIEGATKAGMRTVWISQGRRWPPELPVRPTFEVQSLREVRDILPELAPAERVQTL
jgi:putative hydrolase of the HAD superfamily